MFTLSFSLSAFTLFLRSTIHQNSPFRYCFLFYSGNLSIAYLNVVLGISSYRSSIKFSNTFTSFFPTSLNIHPTALCIKSCLSPSSNPDTFRQSSNWFALMKVKVERIEILLSQTTRLLHNLYNSSVFFWCSSKYTPTIFGADKSTKSQLLTWFKLLK